MKHTRICNTKNETEYFYDRRGRVIKKIINNKITQTFTYVHTLTREIVKSCFKFGDHEVYFEYKYNRKGQILSIKRNGKLLSNFAYNKQGKLVKENNFELNLTIIFNFDQEGNLISKEKIEHTMVPKRFVYFYNYKDENGCKKLANVKDLDGFITICNDEQYVHNSKNQLMHIADVFKYEYDSSNNRLLKTVGSLESNCDITRFIYENNKLVEQSGSKDIHFNYCGNDLIGFTFGDEDYFYMKDLDDSVLGIFNSSGVPVCEYMYYSNGNHIIYIYNNQTLISEMKNCNYTQSGLNNYSIAETNPLRYKSRYFDIESGLYYFNGKYYDAEISIEI